MNRVAVLFISLLVVLAGSGAAVAQDATPTAGACPSGMATPAADMASPAAMATETATPSGMATPDAMATPGAMTCTVEIINFAFEPSTIEIDAGTTVTWTNRDTAPHTATAEDGAFDSGRLDTGQSFDHTFDTPGSFPYHCDFHPNMTGTVTVR